MRIETRSLPLTEIGQDGAANCHVYSITLLCMHDLQHKLTPSGKTQ